mmetsp:Transcript_13222/g.26433  ORF Transcript_13222/g.26433 Transcript_13222/m.26433 type:complete len:170 (+) Transcript_13222:162-671(+)|eukprot:CAMPEP_0181329826 /NCGR_PEP_ID=MMETSP1101-20121128/23538_1 /TAXON_ID=46948 /ORGANISM="Rhodomonas abbreviata, Strain Caron Lab Isolate" /LENGTH=169 /DNA_ID=CAMNT_0023438971 /DNA_START=162 /DNA_END=671 /DNA_ORIENTATION=+
MDPFVVPALGALMAGGIIGGGQVVEDWDEKDGLRQKLARWDPLNFYKKEADAIRQGRGSPPTLGFFYTTSLPHRVDEIVSLVDANGIHFSDRAYSNPEIRPGDKLLYIEDMRADEAPTHLVRRALQSGGRPTTVTITFQRDDHAPFSATLMRHVASNSPPTYRQELGAI